MSGNDTLLQSFSSKQNIDPNAQSRLQCHITPLQCPASICPSLKGQSCPSKSRQVYYDCFQREIEWNEVSGAPSNVDHRVLDNAHLQQRSSSESCPSPLEKQSNLLNAFVTSGKTSTAETDLQLERQGEPVADARLESSLLHQNPPTVDKPSSLYPAMQSSGNINVEKCENAPSNSATPLVQSSTLIAPSATSISSHNPRPSTLNNERSFNVNYTCSATTVDRNTSGNPNVGSQVTNPYAYRNPVTSNVAPTPSINEGLQTKAQISSFVPGNLDLAQAATVSKGNGLFTNQSSVAALTSENSGAGLNISDPFAYRTPGTSKVAQSVNASPRKKGLTTTNYESETCNATKCVNLVGSQKENDAFTYPSTASNNETATNTTASFAYQSPGRSNVAQSNLEFTSHIPDAAKTTHTASSLLNAQIGHSTLAVTSNVTSSVDTATDLGISYPFAYRDPGATQGSTRAGFTKAPMEYKLTAPYATETDQLIPQPSWKKNLPRPEYESLRAPLRGLGSVAAPSTLSRNPRSLMPTAAESKPPSRMAASFTHSLNPQSLVPTVTESKPPGSMAASSTHSRNPQSLVPTAAESKSPGSMAASSTRSHSPCSLLLTGAYSIPPCNMAVAESIPPSRRKHRSTESPPLPTISLSKRRRMSSEPNNILSPHMNTSGHGLYYPPLTTPLHEVRQFYPSHTVANRGSATNIVKSPGLTSPAGRTDSLRPSSVSSPVMSGTKDTLLGNGSIIDLSDEEDDWLVQQVLKIEQIYSDQHANEQRIEGVNKSKNPVQAGPTEGQVHTANFTHAAPTWLRRTEEAVSEAKGQVQIIEATHATQQTDNRTRNVDLDNVFREAGNLGAAAYPPRRPQTIPQRLPQAAVNDNSVIVIPDAPAPPRPEFQNKPVYVVPSPPLATTVEPRKKEAVVVIPDTPIEPKQSMNTHMPPVKSKEDILGDMCTQVMQLFPDVDTKFLRELLRKSENGNDDLKIHYACNFLLENKYPKAKARPVKTTSEAKTAPKAASRNYFTEYSVQRDMGYRNLCLRILGNNFTKVSMKDLRKILNHYNGNYAPTWKCIMEILEGQEKEIAESLGENGQSIFSKTLMAYVHVGTSMEKMKFSLSILKCGRHKSPMPPNMPASLIAETEFVVNFIKSKKEADDHDLAAKINEQEYESTGQLIECGCCYGEVSFENMVQCYEGHLFCQDCLRHYAQEAVFGQGNSKLCCMTEGCDATFPMSQLEIALPSNVLEKYQDRCQEEAINLADLENLVRCPGADCDYAAIMDGDDKVLKCQNLQCMKETCRHCKLDWAEHFGIPCKEMEKKDETKLRLAYEEKMTQAKIRTCHKCKAGFTKNEGCNKMTCRCGAKQCYICRQGIKDYTHFCQHPRNPGQKCDRCTSCSLWTNPEEDEEQALREIRKEASEARKAEGFEGDKLIGAPDEPQAKKLKTK